MQISKDTRVSEILERYGDIAPLMEVFGVQRVGRYSLRWFLSKALTVEWAARIHRLPLDEFIGKRGRRGKEAPKRWLVLGVRDAQG